MTKHFLTNWHFIFNLALQGSVIFKTEIYSRSRNYIFFCLTKQTKFRQNELVLYRTMFERLSTLWMLDVLTQMYML